MRRMQIAVALLVSGLLVGACSKAKNSSSEPPPKLSEIAVLYVKKDLSKPDPNASYWDDIPAGTITLLAQPMIAPRPDKTTTESLVLQAIHDRTHVAFRLRWKDPERSEAGRLGEYSDALALEFPAREGPAPPVMMGAKDQPVHLFHWRAQYQRDAEKGKPTMEDLYPNKSTDMYPLEFKDAKGGTKEEREKFSPGVAEGNPQSYAKSGVDEIIAEGFSTSSVQEGHGSAAHGEWKDGEWTLVIVRPMVIDGGSSIRPGYETNVAFAVWQGGQGEVGSRKCVTMAWTPVKVQ